MQLMIQQAVAFSLRWPWLWRD